MSTTPENQRQEAEKLIARMSRDYPYWDERKKYLDWLWGQVPDLLAHIRSLQSAHDTLLREHGKMRECLGKVETCGEVKCIACKRNAEKILNSITTRPLPPTA